jgi:carbamoyltransferase
MIKGRDFWMPFATSMLYERRNEYLENAEHYYAPYMAITFNTKPRAHHEIIAALHPYDLTSRPQMVKKEVNPEYHALITRFEEKTGIGGILNTSFNLHGEPNVETPFDALRTFELSGLPHVAIGNYLISKPVK